MSQHPFKTTNKLDFSSEHFTVDASCLLAKRRQLHPGPMGEGSYDDDEDDDAVV